MSKGQGVMEAVFLAGVAMLVLIIVISVLLSWFFPIPEEQEIEPYSSYADLSIFKDDKVVIDYVRTHCIGSRDSNVWKCQADLVFNDRAVGFVKFLQEKKQNG